jgi:mRNA interferase RelE/StbE
MVRSWIRKHLVDCDNPRTVPGSEILKGTLNGWRYRVGTYRILAIIEDAELTIVIFKVGNRREVYQQL